MLAQFVELLKGWDSVDTQIVMTGALAAMSCALPGTWLVLRRQSLLGDALSHSVLPGIVLAYLAMNWFTQKGWMRADSGMWQIGIFIGATASGVLSAVATELIQQWGRIDRGASIGVVFTTMFAFGLLLIRLFADKLHFDAGCVLYGNLESSAVWTDSFAVPPAAVLNGCMLLINSILVILFFKELRLGTFDPGLAESVGISARGIQIVLMGMTAATLVAAFKTVGAILVISMLIVPPVTARLLTDRLGTMLVIALLIAAVSALLGHVAAITIPPLLLTAMGYKNARGASTTGMMAVVSGGIFVAAILASPRHGLIRRGVDHCRLRIRIAGEDLLGLLYRREEVARSGFDSGNKDASDLLGTWTEWWARRRLQHGGLITASTDEVRLTDRGRDLARNLVRSHRLWEAYMARHFEIPGDHLHATAEEVEHFLSPELQTELAAELNQPDIDPHGKTIPQSRPGG